MLFHSALVFPPIVYQSCADPAFLYPRSVRVRESYVRDRDRVRNVMQSTVRGPSASASYNYTIDPIVESGEDSL